MEANELTFVVWISPIVANIETRPGSHTAYHGMYPIFPKIHL